MGRKSPSGTDGLEQDVNNLIRMFIATESVRYEEFAKIWRTLNYPLIFSGFKNETFQSTFTYEAFAIVVKFLLPPLDIQTRICGLYILYGLYHAQPRCPPEKIRMDLEHWKASIKLYSELKEQGHLDAAYIFLKLRQEKAFQFVATLRPVIYTRYKTEDAYDKWKAGRELLNTNFDPELLEQLDNIHNQYQNMKKEMGHQDNLSMRLVRDSMADYIVQRIHAHQPSDDEDESESEQEANPAQERAARIANIKKKTIISKGQATGSQRHIGQAKISSETDPDSSPTKAGRRGRRKLQGRRGRKPSTTNSAPSEMDKKRAWSILPMRKLQDPQEEKEKDGDDEDSDSDPVTKKRKKADAAKTAKNAKGKMRNDTQMKGGKMKQERSPSKTAEDKRKRKRTKESEEPSTEDAASYSETSSSSPKKRGRKTLSLHKEDKLKLREERRKRKHKVAKKDGRKRRSSRIKGDGDTLEETKRMRHQDLLEKRRGDMLESGDMRKKRKHHKAKKGNSNMSGMPSGRVIEEADGMQEGRRDSPQKRVSSTTRSSGSEASGTDVSSIKDPGQSMDGSLVTSASASGLTGSGGETSSLLSPPKRKRGRPRKVTGMVEDVAVGSPARSSGAAASNSSGSDRPRVRFTVGSDVGQRDVSKVEGCPEKSPSSQGMTFTLKRPTRPEASKPSEMANEMSQEQATNTTSSGLDRETEANVKNRTSQKRKQITPRKVVRH